MRVRVGVLFSLLFLLVACGEASKPASSNLPDNGQRLYIKVNEGLYKVRASDGKLLWWWNAQLRQSPVPLITKSTVYETDNAGDMDALDARSGKVKWQTPFDHAGPFAVSPGERSVYVGSTGTLYCLDLMLQ